MVFKNPLFIENLTAFNCNGLRVVRLKSECIFKLIDGFVVLLVDKLQTGNGRNFI